MKKSIKILLATLLAGAAVLSVGCSEKTKDEVKEKVNSRIEETFNDKMSKNNGDIEEIRNDMNNFCEVVNNGDVGELPYGLTFRIDEEKEEIRVAIISKNKTAKITNKDDIDGLHHTIYNMIINKGYEGKVYTDIGVYNKTDDEYSIYYTYNYDKNGKGILTPVKNVMSKSELFDYYNH